ncbi:MAG: hypothetical protein QOG09_1529 [Solirubrobacterales bacterium]|nr:hypothetical protein [Solirubrobacterales bacterium]
MSDPNAPARPTATTDADRGADRAATGRPSLIVGALHLAVLWAFAFQRPLFDLLGRNADFFVVRGNTRGDIIVFALAFTLLPPLAMLAAEWLALRFRRGLYEGLHLALLGLLGAAIALQFLKDNVASGPAGLLIVVALALGALLAWAYRRTVFAPQALSVLSPAPLLFLVIFLFFTPVQKLILPQKQAEAADIDVPSTTPIVVLITDEFPIVSMLDARGQVDASRFPNFAALARGSTWYRDTTTVAGFTTRAVPAILTGNDPRNRLPISSDQPDSIFTLLGRSYRMNVDETATAICPPQICGGTAYTAVGGAARQAKQSNGRFRTRMHQLVSDLGIVSEHLLLPDALASHLPAVDQTFGGFGNGGGDGGDGGRAAGKAGSQNLQQVQVGETIRKGAFTQRPQRFERWLSSLRGTPKTLNFLHTELPHFPWLYTPTGKQFAPHTPDIALKDGVWPKDDFYVEYGRQRHLMQAMFTDRLLGELIARMKKVGLWDRAMLVVTADHGSSFIPGQQRRDPQPATMGEIAPVPLFVRLPGQGAGRVDDAHRCTTDILPMIAAELRVRIPFPTYRCSDTVTVAQYNGESTSIPLKRVLALRAAALRRRLRVFPAGGGAEALFRFGPDPQLVGKSVASLSVAPAEEGRATLLGAFDSKPGGTVPVLVQGTLSGVDTGTPLAVALNGRIVTTARAFELLGTTRVAATLPEGSIRPGPNSVEVFRIDGSGESPALERLGGWPR